MDLDIAGSVAVVAGAAQGIGFAIAQQFAKEGASVALLDVDPAVVSAAERMDTTDTARSLARTVDVTRFDEVEASRAWIHDQFGGWDHIVYAAGIGSGKYGFPFWNLAPDDWRHVLEVNLLGAVNVAHAFAPAMIGSGAGTFLFLASIAGQIGSPTDPPYSAAKAAVINFAQCAAQDLAPHDIRVNTICPGMVKTQLNQSVWQAWLGQQNESERQSYDEWAQEKISRVVPLGRWQSVEDVAALAVFLASPRAKNITGQTWNIDGGQVMHW